MKKAFILLITVMSLSLPAKAEDQQQPNPGQNIVLMHIPSSNKRPRVPSTFNVLCEYGDGYLSFTLPENVSTLTFCLYKDGDEISGMVTSENHYVEIPSLHGAYNIECVDDGSRTYAGVLDFQ